jgi:hypothetical protein
MSCWRLGTAISVQTALGSIRSCIPTQVLIYVDYSRVIAFDGPS